LCNVKPENALLPGPTYLLAKRTLDLLVVALTAPIWLPLIGACALALKLSAPRDPIFFRQHRTGKGGGRFSMYKFRTMTADAEEQKKTLAHLNELKWPDFKITCDPRVTRLGRFLRKTSLDELPQVLNVLKGQMTLVGPRPTSFSATRYSRWHTARLDVQPGITGLWQIYGRGTSEFDERLRMDIAYIEHRCLWLDFQILLRTPSAVVGQRGAK
jgi:lipopolysaccharide/colanic/teichoic acid biosynthesis glycosyltransferase